MLSELKFHIFRVFLHSVCLIIDISNCIIYLLSQVLKCSIDLSDHSVIRVLIVLSTLKPTGHLGKVFPNLGVLLLCPLFLQLISLSILL
jgi:hypothetical protein